MERHELLKLKGVVGHGYSTKIVAGQDTGERCVRVLVKKKLLPEAVNGADMVPATLSTPEGVIKTDVVEVGEVVAWGGAEAPPTPTQTDDPAAHLKKYRPVCGGISIGPTNFLLAGTLGLPVVYKGDQQVILSNTHVMAPYWYKLVDPPPGWEEKYGIHVGAPIRQPSMSDGGTEADYVALLLAWTEISLTQPNSLDAAIAVLTVPANAELLNLGTYTALADAQLGDQVAKSGRTTGVTFGAVEVLDLTVQVQYPHGIATMEHMIAFSGSMSAAGDSGSAIVRKSDNALVSLLFAGSGATTIGMPIKAVFDHFGLSLVPQGVPVQTALSSIIDKLQIVWGWDNRGKKWSMYDPADHRNSDLALMQKGRGYWVKVSADCQLSYQGITWDLGAGWNLIGWWNN